MPFATGHNIQGNAIYIKHFDDRLEISNSGPLPAQVNVYNMKEERYSRNPRIARALEDMGFVRQLNEGVSRIYKSMEESMLSTPQYVVKNKNVYLTLRNRVSKHNKTITDIIIKHIQENWIQYNDTQRKILQFILYNHKGTVSELSDYTGINEKTVCLYLNSFIDDDKILIRLSEKQRDKNAKYAFRKE